MYINATADVTAVDMVGGSPCSTEGAPMDSDRVLDEPAPDLDHVFREFDRLLLRKASL